ncbi:MAG TPA: AAC(3) family N-acetyltransferase [Acidimicrobiales bacterium]|nr:AAC(3) family N-acetyltransferase [Acidimicrobiales bacterium]
MAGESTGVTGVVTRAEVKAGAERLGLGGGAVCLHASLRSFPRLEDGPATLIDGLLAAGTTVLVATMANEAFSVPAPVDDRPARNAIDYADKDRLAAESPWPGTSAIYDRTSTEVDSWLGATSAYVVARPERIRSRRSPEFSAIGALAADLMAGETGEDVFGPLRALVALEGGVLLAGVSLIRMTLLHLAETVAGRRPFIRWMRGADGKTIRVRGGECSLGFDSLSPVLAPIERTTLVGASLWRAFPAREVVELAAEAIRNDPWITHCDDSNCTDCADAIAGGPID